MRDHRPVRAILSITLALALWGTAGAQGETASFYRQRWALLMGAHLFPPLVGPIHRFLSGADTPLQLRISHFVEQGTEVGTGRDS